MQAITGSGRIPYWATYTTGQNIFSVIFGTLAKTPAGWIIAIGGAATAISALWQARTEIKTGKRLGFLTSTLSLVAISCSFLWPIFQD